MVRALTVDTAAMNLIVDIVVDLLLPDHRRGPRVDPVTCVIAIALGALVGGAMHEDLLTADARAIAWLVVPAMATIVVGTLLRRRNVAACAALSVAMALAVALPLALFETMFGFWL